MPRDRQAERNPHRDRAERSGFAFHHVNAFEDGDCLLIDMIAYSEATIIYELYLARLRAGTPIEATGLLTRFRVPLSGNAPVASEVLSPLPVELPRINYEAHAGKPYRYVWGTGIEVKGDFLDSIVKMDLETGDATRWYEPGLYPGEPVYVPAPAAASGG
ncbi:MAG: carotenoid oxygenase family protein [Methyloceanibacter sp.]